MTAAPSRPRRPATGWRHRTRALAVGALTAVLTLGGCGADEPPPEVATLATETPPAPSATSSSGTVDAEIAWARCLREHGVEFPDAGPDEGFTFFLEDGSAEARRWAEAEAACASELARVVDAREPLDATELARRQEQAVAFARCLRDHGVDWPDPVVDADGGMSVPDVPDVSGEVMEAVFAACHHHLVDDPADLPSADAP